jgi:FkbM family methyltransferase
MNPKYERIASPDGRIYWIERDDNLYRSRFTASGNWQHTNFRFAQTLIDNWTRCIDIGSNMACSAVQYSERFHIVECFEPTPMNIELWHLTIGENKITNCHLHEVALGECEKTAEIILHEKNGGHNHLNNADRPRWTGTKWAERIPKERRRASTQVQVKTLDSYEFHDVGFMKLDVEGYEYFVLQGAQETIKANRPTLQLEIRANQCRKFGYWAEDMIEWIRSLDYLVMSKKTGQVLDGEFKSYRNELRYRGEYLKGEMDLFFQPRERMRWSKFYSLFDIVA